MTELEHAIKHIKTRADAWAVKEVTEALQSISERLDKALSQEPTDAISRDAVIKAVDAHTNEDGTLDDDISVILEDLPPVTQTPKYWIDKDNKIYKMPDDIPQKSGKWTLMYEPKNMVVCSECEKCAYMYQDKTSAFCPNCGARMESEDKE